MFKMRQAYPGMQDFRMSMVWESKKYPDLYKKLEDMKNRNALQDGDHYIIFQCKGKKERVIQIYCVQNTLNGKGKLILGLMPEGWWWTPKMRQEAEWRAEEEFDKHRSVTIRTRNEDFHADG